MIGLLRADLVRLGKRTAVRIVLVAVPLLAAFFFLVGYQSAATSLEPLDEQSYRQQLIEDGFLEGLPPEEAEQLLDEMVASERQDREFQHAQAEAMAARFAFPQSLLTAFESGSLVFFALVLLTASTTGDEFSWGTIRLALLASSDRRRWLLARLATIGLFALVMLASLVVVGVVLPGLLSVLGANPPPTPGISPGGFGILLVGELAVAAMVIAFAILVTLLVRSGSLTLVVMLVYVIVELAFLALLLRFPAFSGDGPLAWLPDVFPVRAVARMVDGASHLASGGSRFIGDPGAPEIGAVLLPLGAILVWTLLFGAAAFRRFWRMDIVE